MVHVASLRRSHEDEDEAEDEQVNAMCCIELFYPYFTVFFVLAYKSNLVISFSINRTPRAGGEVTIQPSLSHP
jgi:hypothetical protein